MGGKMKVRLLTVFRADPSAPSTEIIQNHDEIRTISSYANSSLCERELRDVPELSI